MCSSSTWQWHVQGLVCWPLHLAMCSLTWLAGPDARHLGRYEPEGPIRAQRLLPMVQSVLWTIVFPLLHANKVFLSLSCRSCRFHRLHQQFLDKLSCPCGGVSTGAVLGQGYGCFYRCCGPDSAYRLEVPQLQLFNKVRLHSCRGAEFVPHGLADRRDSVAVHLVIDVPPGWWWSWRAENCGFHSCSSCLVVDMPGRCRRCSSCAVWTSLCSCSDEIQLLVLTAGLWGLIFWGPVHRYRAGSSVHRDTAPIIRCISCSGIDKDISATLRSAPPPPPEHEHSR